MAEWIDDEGWVFEEGGTVHGEWMVAFKKMIAAKDTARIDRSIVQLLESKFIRFWKKKDPDKTKKYAQVTNARGGLAMKKFDRFGSVNDNGRAYSAMEQGDLLLLFWEVFKLTRKEEHRELAIAAGEVLTDPYDKGGLKLGDGWFSAQTSKSQKDIGMTLNKHLMAIRNLYVIGGEMRKVTFINAAIKAASVTVTGDGWKKKDKVPNIYDYVPRRNGNIVNPTWLFYGMKGNGDPYFLSANDWKNANYHLYCMRLIHRLMVEMGSDFPINRWRSTGELGGVSILKWMGDAYREKLRRGAYITHSTPAPGNFSAINKDHTPLLSNAVLAVFA